MSASSFEMGEGSVSASDDATNVMAPELKAAAGAIISNSGEGERVASSAAHH
jgi:hypothetical protein